LENIIEDRKNNPTQKSYTSSLFQKGINKIAQKVGVEAIELVIEAKDDNAGLFKNEAADLLFHYLILLKAKGFKLNDVVEILRQRKKKLSFNQVKMKGVNYLNKITPSLFCTIFFFACKQYY
jgi:phosphoribosyl-ATP pyrophosphohydrolase/phosphoribosyl-AMP cyclohydrolase